MNDVTQWHGCYSGSWNGILVADAFAHPAKVAPGLAYRIYRHMLDAGYIQPGDAVVDPFGGIGGFGYHAILLGLHWTGVELEPRFVELGQRNLEKWRRDLAMLNGTLGTARLLQGDSRRLLEVVGASQTAASRCSPPFETTVNHDGGRADYLESKNLHSDYGQSPGQLAAMPTGDYAAAVTSPPFSGDKNLMAVNDQGVRSEMVARRGIVESDTQQSPGNLAALRADDAGFTAAVSSPPYADNAATWVEGPGARHDLIHHNGDNAYKVSSDNGYGATPGNVGHMRDAGFEAAVSSPPYEHSLESRGDGIDWEKTTAVHRGHRSAGRGAIADGYGHDPGNIGGDTGDTFWAAARVIVEQTYAVLKPGGHTAWVTKRFVRDKKIVEFSEQWAQLCEAVGFVRVEWVRAMLVEDHGDQLDIFGGVTTRGKQRKSFFRRLAEKKGSPRIDWEDVLILRKPL